MLLDQMAQIMMVKQVILLKIIYQQFEDTFFTVSLLLVSLL